MSSDTDGSLAGALGLPDHDVGREELERIARRVAGREDLWRPLARFEGGERGYESLHVDEHVGIWVISWMPGNDTGWHDHDGSAGAVAVAHGTIREERPYWNAEPRRIDPGRGGSFGFGPDEIHRMVNVGDAVAVTVHVYSPPLRRMGMYRIDDDGYIRRCGVESDTELEA